MKKEGRAAGWAERVAGNGTGRQGLLVPTPKTTERALCTPYLSCNRDAFGAGGNRRLYRCPSTLHTVVCLSKPFLQSPHTVVCLVCPSSSHCILTKTKWSNFTPSEFKNLHESYGHLSHPPPWCLNKPRGFGGAPTMAKAGAHSSHSIFWKQLETMNTKQDKEQTLRRKPCFFPSVSPTETFDLKIKQAKTTSASVGGAQQMGLGLPSSGVRWAPAKHPTACNWSYIWKVEGFCKPWTSEPWQGPVMTSHWQRYCSARDRACSLELSWGPQDCWFPEQVTVSNKDFAISWCLQKKKKKWNCAHLGFLNPTTNQTFL